MHRWLFEGLTDGWMVYAYPQVQDGGHLDGSIWDLWMEGHIVGWSTLVPSYGWMSTL